MASLGSALRWTLSAATSQSSESRRRTCSCGSPRASIRRRLRSTSGAVRAIPAAPASELDRYVIYGATIALGPIALQVLYTTVPQLSVAYALEERPAINLIWPYRAPFDWGEREEFAGQGFANYMDALPSVLRRLT
jgi:hypothetical protein